MTPQAIAQPAGQNSTLIPTNFNAAAAPAAGNIILDSTFAGWIQGALTTVVGGKPTSMVGDATFTFQQCFGGGFLDDLNNTITGAGVNWVGGAASSFDEPSYGQNPARPSPRPVNPFPPVPPTFHPPTIGPPSSIPPWSRTVTTPPASIPPTPTIPTAPSSMPADPTPKMANSTIQTEWAP